MTFDWRKHTPRGQFEESLYEIEQVMIHPAARQDDDSDEEVYYLQGQPMDKETYNRRKAEDDAEIEQEMMKRREAEEKEKEKMKAAAKAAGSKTVDSKPAQVGDSAQSTSVGPQKTSILQAPPPPPSPAPTTTTTTTSMPPPPAPKSHRPLSHHPPPPQPALPKGPRDRSPSPVSTVTKKKKKLNPPPPPPPTVESADQPMDVDPVPDDTIIIDDTPTPPVAGPSRQLAAPPAQGEISSTSESKPTRKGKEKEKETKKVVLAPRAVPSGGRKSGPTWREKVVEKWEKLNEAKLRAQFPTITSYINDLRQYEYERPYSRADAFRPCRVVVVNGTSETLRNPLHFSLRNEIGRMLHKGFTVLTPEEFVPSVPGARKGDPASDARAEEEGWTTHVYSFQGFGSPVAFPKILSQLGANGMEVEEIGDYCRVVNHDWISQSIMRVTPIDEYEYEMRDDPRRKKIERKKKVEKKKELRVETKDTLKDKKGARKSGGINEDTDSASGSADEDGAPHKPISPYGIHDWPLGQDPPPSELAFMEELKIAKSSGATVSATRPQASASSPIAAGATESSRTASTFNFEGLTEQFELLKKIEAADAGDLLYELDEGKKFNDKEDEEAFAKKFSTSESLAKKAIEEDMILSKRADDNLTDEEKEKGSGDKEEQDDQYKPRDGHFTTRIKYACDRSSTGGDVQAGPNEGTASVLELLGTLAEKGSFRERSYQKAAGILRNKKKEKIDTYEKAIKIYGIGDSIATKILEIVRTGTHRKTKFTTEKRSCMKIFTGIYGVGERKAEDFYEEGCRTLEDVQTNPIIKTRLTDSQRLGIKYYNDLQERIPRDEVSKIHQHAVEAAALIDPKLEVMVMGSYRRGEPTCGDVDLMVTRDTSDGKDHKRLIKKLAEALEKDGIIRHSLTNPDDWKAEDVKFNGLCALEGGKMRRIDILGVPWDEMPAALIYFTGNSFFNRSMRLKARHLGYRLNQRGLYKDVSRNSKGEKLTEGNRIPCKTEEEIFKILHVPYRPPTERRP